MPRGVRTRSAAPVAQGSAPMVLIEPVDDGSIQFNAYGLSGGAIVDVLRRSLLHVVALQAGVEVISMEVPAHGAVVVAARPALVASRNSAGKTKTVAASRPKRLRSFDQRDEDYFTDGIEEAEV